MRKVILHNHLFKNAGTTLDWCLEKKFKSLFLDHREDQKMIHEKDHLQNLLDEERSLLAISSHNLRFPLPDQQFHFITLQMIRHPLERVSSVYLFEKGQVKSKTPGAVFARNHSLNDYVKWRMKAKVGCTIRNFQTRKLGVPFSIIHDDSKLLEHFNIAKEYIQRNPLIGLVDRYDQSMVFFEGYLINQGYDIDLSYIKQNTGQLKNYTFEQKINYLQYELDSSTFNELIEKNEYDIRIYELVKSTFNKIIDTNSKLITFQTRCKSKTEN